MPTPRKNGITKLPKTFVARFWEDADSRTAAVKEVKRRYEMLVEHTGAESYQQDLLIQRAVFISVQLESMEIEAMNTGELEAGVYAQMTNTLMGLLQKLGLKRADGKVLDLRRYVEER